VLTQKKTQGGRKENVSLAVEKIELRGACTPVCMENTRKTGMARGGSSRGKNVVGFCVEK